MLPTGTVTFLFTDVVGNVPIWERDPIAMKAALARHHDILYAAAQHHHGLVFKILGDEFQIAFEVPENALEAALQAQRGLRDESWGVTGPLTVRMGLHTGPAEVIEGVLNTRDYAVSHTINRVACIRSAAHGGQILLSSATAELLHGYRPQDIHLRDLGECYLKGMSLPEHLYQVVVPDLPDAFPPLISISHPNHNLPIQLTSFIGREKEMAVIRGLLQDARLVTLTGPGGTGKTRLALQTAVGLLEQYVDGIWLVELAPLSDSAMVPTLAARALGLREQTGSQMMTLLQEYLEKRQVLLILDNCEHVIEACARLAEALLQACPKLSILTSSREALGIAGEISFRVPPLTFPEVGALPPLEALTQSEAVRLFVERAATVQTTASAVQITSASPGFSLTLVNAPAVLQICQRLDGIPLAIELAAARVKLLQVAEIAQHLDDRFRLLTGGSRAALPRYQTLRASIDWSYDLLSEAERSLLQRLSVFAGGWVLEAAEAVGCGEGIQARDVLELLGHLIDKSLVQTISSTAGLNRFRMLETIRQYAHEKLVEAGQAEAARYRHLQYYLELAERLGGKIRGPDIARILERLEAELDNLRLALAWSLEGKGKPGWDPEPGLRLAAALWWFWWCRGRQEEGIQWLELLLAGEAEERGVRPLTPERTRCRARALLVTSFISFWIGEERKAGKLSAESCALYQSLGADGRVGYAWACITYNPLANPTEAIRIREQALVILREAGDRFGVGEFLSKLGQIALYSNEYERAKTYWDENMTIRKEIGDLDGLAGAILEQSLLAEYRGEYQQARGLTEECIRIFTTIHSDSYLGLMTLNLAYYDALGGNYVQAATHVHEGLSIGRRQGDVNLIHTGLLALGRLALIQQNYPEATEWFEEDLAYCRIKDHKTHMAEALYYLGLLAWDRGKCEQASKLCTEALIDMQESENKVIEGFLLYHLGKVSFAQGEMALALVNFKQALRISFSYLGLPLLFRNLDLTMLALEGMAALAADAQSGGLYRRFPATQEQYEATVRLLGATESWHTLCYLLASPPPAPGAGGVYCCCTRCPG